MQKAIYELLFRSNNFPLAMKTNSYKKCFYISGLHFVVILGIFFTRLSLLLKLIANCFQLAVGYYSEESFPSFSSFILVSVTQGRKIGLLCACVQDDKDLMSHRRKQIVRVSSIHYVSGEYRY